MNMLDSGSQLKCTSKAEYDLYDCSPFVKIHCIFCYNPYDCVHEKNVLLAIFAHFKIFTEVNKTNHEVVKCEMLWLYISFKMSFSPFLVKIFKQEKVTSCYAHALSKHF